MLPVFSRTWIWSFLLILLWDLLMVLVFAAFYCCSDLFKTQSTATISTYRYSSVFQWNNYPHVINQNFVWSKVVFKHKFDYTCWVFLFFKKNSGKYLRFKNSKMKNFFCMWNWIFIFYGTCFWESNFFFQNHPVYVYVNCLYMWISLFFKIWFCFCRFFYFSI